MTQPKIHHIWPPSTGIKDYEVDPQSLAASEIPGIKAVWQDQRRRLQGSEQLADFTERLSREWAIETGIIEDLYDIERGVTQTLIERGFQAELLSFGSTNKPREFVLQLLRDQKDALDGVFAFVRDERPLSTSYVKELHAALLRSQLQTEAVDSLGNLTEVPLITGDWKKLPNYPVRDGVTYVYCPPEHVAAEMDRLIAMHQQHLTLGVSAEVASAWLHHRFAQIHPFQDGNGRVARALASLVLIKEGLFPLVVTRDDRTSYIDALEAADNGDLKPLVELFAKLQRVQFARATALSEAVLADAGVDALLGDLRKAAEKAAADKRQTLRRVFEWVRVLEDDARHRLEDIAPDVRAALGKVSASATASVITSNLQTDYYYRAQIIENAKNHLHYFADTSEYRSWVALNMVWERRARLVFAFHGIGRPFNGSLICAPFLDFRDTDDEGQTRSTLVPVAEEGFVFFYNDTRDRLLSRFRPWREQVLKVALKELSQNL
jgi:hypothetical protein